MGMRTNIELVVQAGFDNGLDDLALSRELSEQLDTMDHATVGSGKLAANETGTQLDMGDVEDGYFLYIEADGTLQVYINGAAPTPAIVDAAGASYPQGFAGGETLTFDLDGTSVSVAFEAADTTITNVVNRINAAIALLGISTPVASDNGGQLRLTSPTTGSSSTIENVAGTAAADLGLGGASDAEGTDPVANTGSWELKRMGDHASESAVAGLRAYLVASVQVSSIWVTNPSAEDAVSYRYAVIGDLTESAAC